MDFEKIGFYYFSGTGNTLLVVRKMKDVFEKNGSHVLMHPIEKTDPKTIDLSRVIGLAFPVAEQGTYPFVWDFVEALPESAGTPIFLVDTLFLYSGCIIGSLRKAVAKKGYLPIAAREIRMPSNLFPGKIDKRKNEEGISKGLKEAERYAHDILAGKAHWGRVPVLSDILGWVSRKSFGTVKRLFPLKVDRKKCARCGLCVKLCPVHNIDMPDYPEFKRRCASCMRCVSFCPTQAIHTPTKRHEQYHSVSADAFL
jgi:NAD-dependent dihydropyrimidine dehydrogenase PreA subunit